MFCIEYYIQYRLGRKFTVRTDHRTLSFLFLFKESIGRLARYLEILSAYDFIVIFRKGIRGWYVPLCEPLGLSVK